MSQAWAALLHAWESEVDAAWSTETGSADPTGSGEWTGEAAAFVPPPGLGPLPPALVERAVTLLQRMYDVQEHLEQRQGEIGRELSALRSARTAATAPAVPHFLDTTA